MSNIKVIKLRVLNKYHIENNKNKIVYIIKEKTKLSLDEIYNIVNDMLNGDVFSTKIEINIEKFNSDFELELFLINLHKFGVTSTITDKTPILDNNLLSIHDIYSDICRINSLEKKGTFEKISKFNEEFGELNAEILKLYKLTYKPYNRKELLGEMADSMQVLLSIFDSLHENSNITLNDILLEISEKNKKWENKIKDYIK